MGTLPTFANAKDDAYVIYAEDGEHCLKMKREYFTADIEQLGCDYWKEGSGIEIKNPGGTHAPSAEDTSWIPSTLRMNEGEMYADYNVVPEYHTLYQKTNLFTKYSAQKKKDYHHAGDFWVCFKLRESESEINSDYIVCGDRITIDSGYYNDPSSASFSLIDSINRINGFPAGIVTFAGTQVYSAVDFVTNTRYNISQDAGHTILYDFSAHFPYDGKARKAVATYGRPMGFGFHGIGQAGTVFTITPVYKNDLSSVFTYTDLPPYEGCDYAQWADEEYRSQVAAYYDINTVYDTREPFGVDSASLSHLYFKDYYSGETYAEKYAHKLYKLGIDDEVIAAPTLASPTFCHVLNILRAGAQSPSTIPSEGFVRPKGVLCSIPVVGVESYNAPIYDGAASDCYDGYSNVCYFEIIHQAGAWTEYRISKSFWPMRMKTPCYSLVSSEPHYYVNDLLSDYIRNNYIAVSRKGLRIMMKTRYRDEIGRYRSTNPPYSSVAYVDSQGNIQQHTMAEGEVFEHDYYNGVVDRWLNIGINGFMNQSDIDGLQYDTNSSYLDMDYEINNNAQEDDLISDIWDIEKTNAHPWEYNSVPIESDFYVLSTGDNYVAFKDRYTIPFTFDSNTIKVTHITPQSGVDYDLISLKTLWKMTLKVNNETKFILDTNYNGTRPSEMNLNFNPNQTKNYGFGDEFTIDTVNSDISLPGFRVDSNTIRTAGTKSIRANSIVMRDNTGKYQSIRLINSESSSTVARQANTSAKFRPEQLYFCNWQISSNSTITNSNTGKSPLYKSYKKVSINDISGYNNPYNAGDKGNLYLVGTMTSDGYFQVLSNASSTGTSGRNGYITDKLPTSANSNYYIFLGEYDTIDGTTYFNFAEVNPIYFYKNGRIQEYHYGESTKYLSDMFVKESGQEVSVKNDDGTVRINFDNHFNNTFDQTIGKLTLNIDTSTLPTLEPESLIFADTDVVTNVAASTLTKVDDIQGLRFNNTSRRAYVDVSVIFKTHDGSAMTDGVFEARLNYSSTLDNFICGVSGPGQNCTGGYFKKRKKYVSGESEVVVRMKGFVYDSQSIGSTYPYIVVKHSCSTNIDVDYCINGFIVS